MRSAGGCSGRPEKRRKSRAMMMMMMMMTMRRRGSTSTTGWTPWPRRGNSSGGRSSLSRGGRRRLNYRAVNQRTPTSGGLRRWVEERSPRGRRGRPVPSRRRNPDPRRRRGHHRHPLSLVQPRLWRPGRGPALAHQSWPEGPTRVSKKSMNLNTTWGSGNHLKKFTKACNPYYEHSGTRQHEQPQHPLDVGTFLPEPF
jgi:hypothetical protein